ncbi:metalloendopeptidase [Aureococcus anophagefferens]|uniref:Metalloendopeptidase n=1 Tax=Aureococcus anophagefferens TaxID=44056 RepID=A0ABR1GAR3_AURAN
MLITYLGVDRLLRAEDALDGDGDDGAPDAALLPAEKRGRDATYTSVCRGALRPALRGAGLRAHLALQRVVVRRVRDLRRRQRRALRRRAALGLGRGARRLRALPGALFLGDRLDSLRWCNAAGLGLGVLFSGLGHERWAARVRAVVAKTLVAFTVFYMAVGLSGAALYADVSSELALSFSENPLDAVAVMAYVLQLVPAKRHRLLPRLRDGRGLVRAPVGPRRAREPAAEPRPRGPRRHRRRLRRRRAAACPAAIFWR